MIIYFDTETTGLSPGGIIQLSYIMQDSNGVVGKNFFFFNKALNSSRLLTPKTLYKEDVCILTVFSERNKSAAISFLLLPSIWGVSLSFLEKCLYCILLTANF